MRPESSVDMIPQHEQWARRVCVTVLGGWSASLEPGCTLDLSGRKSQALLAYLALHRGQPQPRAKLMTLLWGDHDEHLAGQSLRRALYLIRRALGARADDVLKADADTVVLAPANLEVDAVEFERLAAEDSPGSLERAAALYRGELLEGCDVGSAGFEDWLRRERERLYELAVQSLGKLLAHWRRMGQDDAALQVALRLLALDPAQESVHRAAMRLYDRLGRRAAALRQYQVCVDALQREFRTEPEAETSALYLAILRGERPELHGTEQAGAPAVRRHESSPDRTEIPLVGRTEEMRQLVAALESAAEGRGGLILIAGEAGIGKTRLLAEIGRAAAHRGCRVFLGHSYETEQVLPFRPFIEALRADGGLHQEELLAGLPQGHRAELARLFPELGSPPGAPAMSPEAHAPVFDAMAELLRRLSEARPLLLVLEDIHCADDMSLRLLAFLARRLVAWPMLLIASFREEDADDAPALDIVLDEMDRQGAAVRLTLDALSRAETSELVRVLDPGPGDEARAGRRAARVWQTSAGLPFVIVETVREIQERGDTDDDEASAVPLRVRHLIEARLARLSDPARHLMAVTAVAGQPVGFDLLVRATGMSEGDTAQAIERLVRRRILQASGDRFEFCHERVRTVVYEGLLPGLKRALHRAVGLALEALPGDAPQDVDDRLAHHFVQAGLADRAITSLLRVAGTARRRNALVSALRPLDHALALVDQLPPAERDRRRLGLALEKGFVLSMLKRYVELFDLLAPRQPDVDTLGDPAVTAPYCFLLGVSCVPRGELGRVTALARRSIEEGSRCRDTSTVGMSHFLTGWVAGQAGRNFAEAAEHCRRATELLDAREDAHYRGWSFYFLAQHLYCLGSFGPALEAAAQPAIIAEACGAPQIRAIASISGAILGAIGEGEKAVRESERCLERAVDLLTRTTALGWLGLAHVEAGDADRAVSILQRAVEGYRAVALRATEARALGILGDAHLLRGDVDEARAAARLALGLMPDLEPSWTRAWAERVLGRAARAAGDLATAERHLHEALGQFGALGARFETARTSLELAELLHTAGRREDGRVALARAQKGFSSARVPVWQARAAELARRLARAS